MTVTAISLMDPVSGLTVPIMPRDGVSAQQIDAGAPARGVVESRVGARGGVDTTRFLDEGTLSLSLLLWPGLTTSQTPEGFMDEIGPLLDPGLRPALVVTNDAWKNGPRRCVLRFDSVAKPFNDPTQWPVQINWTVPDSCWEDQTQTQAVVNAFVSSSTGLSIDVPGLQVSSAGYIMPASSAPSPSQVISPGSANSQWTALLYGPCVAPKLANDVTGRALEFTDALVLNAGDYVLLNSQNETALLNGSQPDVTGALNFSTSNWWLMQQGLNILRYYPSTADAGSQAVITFRGAYPL